MVVDNEHVLVLVAECTDVLCFLPVAVEEAEVGVVGGFADVVDEGGGEGAGGDAGESVGLGEGVEEEGLGGWGERVRGGWEHGGEGDGGAREEGGEQGGEGGGVGGGVLVVQEGEEGVEGEGGEGAVQARAVVDYVHGRGWELIIE